MEGLEWSFVNYQDNQICLDLIEGSPISICSLINEVGNSGSLTTASVSPICSVSLLMPS